MELTSNVACQVLSAHTADCEGKPAIETVTGELASKQLPLTA
jgi:hypothetical protein